MAVHDLYFYLSSLGSVLSTLPLLDPKWWSTWSSALLRPTIAGVAALIAHRQAKTARNKLKFDLFERRFAVYDATVLLINKAI
ncbi:hypothetical protein J8I87_39835 [Paraburkholderia sp. LEh10]|uniref:hypothetical protein n=1 Tax=Paraburkholderia sp. LEh10 TaxID=2821353 RepID=UPI001AE7F174|nr:hypothetical protein [Paraburkholderia sp. LEh10]MBP0595686.1 hypothetical protein [Paraburkholderia sp. LEh10]